MRPVLVTILLLSALLPLPGAAAKALAEDPAGDAQLTLLGTSTGAAAPAGGEAVDLLSLEVIEDAETLVFVVKVSNLKQAVSFASYDIFFSWGKTEYAIYAMRQLAPPVLEEESSAYLVSEEDERWDPLAELEHSFDVDNGLLTIHLPKAYILSENGRYPLLGDSLDDLVVEARSHLTLFQFSSDAYDRMPDGDDSLRYPFLFGDLASGSLRLDADDRVRVSNGGATTFVYQVTIENKAEGDDEVTLTLSDMPPGWNATVQTPVRVPGDSERRVAILVSVPFAHDHGGFSSFNVTATSAENAASIASIRMGVLHTPIPQPAGHHADLYLHAQKFNAGIFGQLFPWSDAYLNTDSGHEGDAPEAGAGFGGDGFGWTLPLDPVLRMGLDFDVERSGTIVGSIIGHTQMAGTLRAELLLFSPDGEESILLGETDGQDVTLDLSNPTPFKLTFTPTEEADYIPYLRGQNLRLVLVVESDEEFSPGSICCLPGMTPGLVTADFKATLPFNEYHDKLNGLSEAAELLDIKAEGPVEKAGLRGATMTYTFQLTNRGSQDEIIDIDLAGTDAGLATIVPNGAITLASKESRTLTLAVSIPTDKNEGEELEVLVFAHAQEDPSKSAIARTKTIVAREGSTEVVADETGVLLAAQEREAADTPAPGALLAVLAVGVAAFMMRRRHA